MATDELRSALRTAIAVLNMVPIRIVHQDGKSVHICKGCGAVGVSPHEPNCWAEAVEIAVSKGFRILDRSES